MLALAPSLSLFLLLATFSFALQTQPNLGAHRKENSAAQQPQALSSSQSFQQSALHAPEALRAGTNAAAASHSQSSDDSKREIDVTELAAIIEGLMEKAVHRELDEVREFDGDLEEIPINEALVDKRHAKGIKRQLYGKFGW